MDKPAKSNGAKIMKYFSRAATFSIPARPYSPTHDRKAEATAKTQKQSKGFSGPIVSLVPAEARQRKQRTRGGVYEEAPPQEPTSPTVTCIGQIKHKKKKKAEEASGNKSRKAAVSPTAPHAKREKMVAKVLRMIFRGKAKAERPPRLHPHAAAAVAAAPKLGQMKRFASSRDALAGFDWRANAVEPLESPDRYDYDAEDSEVEEEGGFRIARSGLALSGGGAGSEGRKEVNLWRRRTMAQPVPLQVC